MTESTCSTSDIFGYLCILKEAPTNYRSHFHARRAHLLPKLTGHDSIRMCQQTESLSKLEEVIALVSNAGDPTFDMPVNNRRRALLVGLASLIKADLWVWSIAVNGRAVVGYAMTTHCVDGGWTSDEQPPNFDQIVCDPRFRFAEAKAIEACSERHVTCQVNLLSNAGRKQFREIWSPTGISHFLLSGYPVGETMVNFAAFYRKTSTADSLDCKQILNDLHGPGPRRRPAP